MRTREIKIARGIDSFDTFRQSGSYYVDKTMLLKDILHPFPDAVILITRPRRFGKSLNLSMLECFLDIERKDEGTSLFDGLAIMDEKKVCEAHMHKYPIIHISFKDVGSKGKNTHPSNYETAIEYLKSEIWELASQYDYLLDSDKLSKIDKKKYEWIIEETPYSEREKDPKRSRFMMDEVVLSKSLLTLSQLLKKHHGTPPVILIDEYDVPLNNAFEMGYYNDFIATYRGLLSACLKGNKSLAFAVITGCLKISKESIFTGLNNLVVYDVNDSGLSKYFGFSDDEVSTMLDYFDLSGYHESVRKFYDGYRFGSQLMYNPWSISNFIEKALDNIADNKPVLFPCEWTKSSSNDILNKMLDFSAHDNTTASEIEALGRGESLNKKVVDQLTFETMYNEPGSLWTVMLHTGYLTCDELETNGRAWLKVPNEELMRRFDDLLLDISRRSIKNGPYLRKFCEAVETFDPIRIEEALNNVLMDVVSLRDSATKDKKENHYQGCVETALSFRNDWSRKANTEAGRGYCDMKVEDTKKRWGIIFELKYSKDPDDFTDALDEGEDQIHKTKYAVELKECITKHLYSIAFHGKECKVREVFDPCITYEGV